MAKKEDRLTDMLNTPIKLGGPLRLSTTAPVEDAITHNRTIAQSRQSDDRVNRGYKLREDLVRRCKRLALDQNRKLYEVMEDALSEYLDRNQSTH